MTVLLAVCLSGLLLAARLPADSLDGRARAALAAGAPATVIVEFDYQPAGSASPLARAAAFAAYKRRIEPALTSAGGTRLRDLTRLPLGVWRVDSLAALTRIESLPGVRRVHENGALHAVSTSDLAFIRQPQAQAAGGTGQGTTVAVIDGGLGTNYRNNADFGTCTAVGAPAACRVLYNADFYPTNAQADVIHGTNVSAIALDVAAEANLAMFNVFNGGNASVADVLTAMDGALQLQSAYNVVAINLSLGDNTSNATPCTGSAFVTAVQNANSAGISVVAAAGNSGSKSGLAAPACTPGVIAVGAVYDGGYGTIGWNATAAAGGTCTEASAADRVTCFSQSASYLAMLAPGTFVAAPNGSFIESGTSQATPHVAGAIAVLRARYPAESLAETLQRLQSSGPSIQDTANGISTHRLDLASAFLLGTAVTLTGTGSGTAVSGTTSTYTVTVKNLGSLAATHVLLQNTFPPNAQLVTPLPGGCTRTGNAVSCSVATLAAGASVTFSIGVQWTSSSPVYDLWRLSTDQINSAPASQQILAFGAPPAAGPSTDGPLPAWVLPALGLVLVSLGAQARRRTGPRSML